MISVSVSSLITRTEQTNEGGESDKPGQCWSVITGA